MGNTFQKRKTGEVILTNILKNIEEVHNSGFRGISLIVGHHQETDEDRKTLRFIVKHETIPLLLAIGFRVHMIGDLKYKISWDKLPNYNVLDF